MAWQPACAAFPLEKTFPSPPPVCLFARLPLACPPQCSMLTSSMTLTLNPCKPATKKKNAAEGATIEQIEKARGEGSAGGARRAGRRGSHRGRQQGSSCVHLPSHVCCLFAPCAL